MEFKGKFVKVISTEDVKKKVSEGVYEPIIDRSGAVMRKMLFQIQLPYAAKEKFLVFETINSILMSYIADLKSGTEITVSASVESREWNGKWFTSASATNVETETQMNESYSAVQQRQPASVHDDGSGLPF